MSGPEFIAPTQNVSRQAHQRREAARRDNLKRLCDEIFDKQERCTLEIGCGHGHWLAAYADAHPQEFCVGVDLITRRVEKSNRKKSLRGLTNLRFLKAEAMELLESLPHTIILEKVFVIFPDPWPKKRHYKRRLIQNGFLDMLARFTDGNSTLFFRTDDENYFSWAIDKVAGHPLWERDETACWPFEHETFFQNILPEYHSLVAVRQNPLPAKEE